MSSAQIRQHVGWNTKPFLIKSIAKHFGHDSTAA